VVLIEDKASGTQLIQELISEGMHAATRYPPEGDKVMRLHAQSGMIENGFVHLPEAAPWLAEYLHELTTFPRARHDDQADSTSQFLEWFKRPMQGAGIYEYYRGLAAEADLSKHVSHQDRAAPPRATWVTLRAPHGMGALQTFSNRRITVPPNGIIEISGDDAACLPPEWIRISERR
jgi:hypothetical protein